MLSVLFRRELALVTLGSIACFSSAEALTSADVGGDSGGSDATAGETSTSNGESGTVQTDSDDDAGTVDGSDEADSGGTNGCEPGLRCVPSPPPTWLGPFAVLPKPPVDDFMCPSEFPELVHDAKAGPRNIEADCACGSCAGTASCDISFAAFAQAGCGGTPAVQTLEAGCHPVSEGMAQPLSFGYQVNALADTCVAPLAGPPPAVEWDQELIACTGFDPESACDVGTCWPQLPMMKICIAREGNDMCPPGWPDKVIAAQDADDNRVCPACECEAEVTCNEQVYLQTTGGCGDLTELFEMDAGVCVNASALAVDVSLAPAGDCSTVDPTPEPTGNVQLIDPLTLCCQV